jgi:hypothetical protein
VARPPHVPPPETELQERAPVYRPRDADVECVGERRHQADHAHVQVGVAAAPLAGDADLPLVSSSAPVE